MSTAPMPSRTEPSRSAAELRWGSLWQLGFRPLFLLANGFAVLLITSWALQSAGVLGHLHLSGPLWRAHETVFAFALAVIVGFLLTAGRNWSGRPTPTGPLLNELPRQRLDDKPGRCA